MSITKVPFFSQIPNWGGEDSGFPDQETADHWAVRGCGIACLRMVVRAFSPLSEARNRSYWEWIKVALKSGAYCEKGWIHDGMRDLARDAAVASESYRGVDVTFVREAIKGSRVAMMSVTVGFEGGMKNSDGNSKAKGGHLVLALGGDNCGLVFHHPSAHKARNWESKTVENGAIANSFSGNIVLFDYL